MRLVFFRVAVLCLESVLPIVGCSEGLVAVLCSKDVPTPPGGIPIKCSTRD